MRTASVKKRFYKRNKIYVFLLYIKIFLSGQAFYKKKAENKRSQPFN